MSGQDVHINNSAVHANTTQGTSTTAEKGTRRAVPLDGRPSITGAIERTDTDVETAPAEFVRTTVTTAGAGVIMGMADTFASKVFSPNSALYVLFASPKDTIPPTEAGTDVLKAYGGVVKVGVERMKLGRVVAMVSELADIKERIASGV